MNPVRTHRRRADSGEQDEKRPAALNIAKAMGWFSLALGAAELTMPRNLAKLVVSHLVRRSRRAAAWLTVRDSFLLLLTENAATTVPIS